MKKNNIDYKLILDMELVPDDLIDWLDLDFLDYYDNTSLKEGRMMRIVGENGTLAQISTPIKDFGRWANDYDYEFDLAIKTERDQFINYVKDNRIDGK